MNDALTVADVARMRGTGRVAAYRWLHRNARAYLRRRGRYVVISAADLARLDGRPIDPRVGARLTDLDSRITDAERRLDVHHRALARLHAV